MQELEKPYSKALIKNCANNIINTSAYAQYSLRSSVRKYEEDLIKKFQKQIEKFNKKYKSLANAQMEIKTHLLPFEKSPNQQMSSIAKTVGKNIGIDVKVQSFHAGAETHIYANKTNKFGEKFRPVLVGVANIDSMHSENERMEIESLKKGTQFVREIFLEFNK